MALISPDVRPEGRTFGNARLALALSWAGPPGIGRVWLACNSEPVWRGAIFDAVRGLTRLARDWEAARRGGIGLDVRAALGLRGRPGLVVGGRPRPVCAVTGAAGDSLRAVTFNDGHPALFGFAQALAEGLEEPLCQDIGGPEAVAAWRYVQSRPAPLPTQEYLPPILSEAPPVDLAAMRKLAVLREAEQGVEAA